ncbi:MAG: hypothetical protein FD119_2586 [Stygiobacter sp.]|nr:MAG: hypothetical protein FD119_2586 [Stygiobacter sp.]
MSIPSFVLSLQDQALLGAILEVEHPTELDQMLKRMPEDRTGMQVEAYYQIKDDDARGWVDCGACGRSHNHKKGLVLRFANGTRTTLGHDCCETKHDIEYNAIIKAHEERKDRASQLRRIGECIDRLPEILAYLDGLTSMPQVRALYDLRSQFGRKFSRLGDRLEGASDGTLYTRVMVTDDEAERQRRRNKERKISDLAKRLNREVEDIDAATVRGHFVNDPDFSRKRLTTTKEKPFHRCEGRYFVYGLPRLDGRLKNVVGRIERAFEPLAGVDSHLIATGVLRTRVSTFEKALNEAVTMIEDINSSSRFFSPANLDGVVRWANAVGEAGGGATLRIDGNNLLREFHDGNPPLTLTIPQVFPEIPLGPLSAVRRTPTESNVADSTATMVA